MKQVVVLRHADWDNVTDELIESGRQQCADLAPTLSPFAIVVSSPTIRTQQTAELLTGKKPTVDNRAGILKSDPEFLAKIAELRKKPSIRCRWSPLLYTRIARTTARQRARVQTTHRRNVVQA